MSAAKRFVLAALVASALVTLNVSAVHAQACPGNPSGGTGLRQTVEEGSGPTGSGFTFMRGLSINPALQSWFGTFAASRYASSVVSRPVNGHSLLAIARRTNGRR